MIRKSVEPLVHEYPGYRPGNRVGNNNKYNYFSRQQAKNTGHRSTQHLANTNLFHTLHGVERRQSEQSKTRNKYSHAREDREQHSFLLLCVIQAPVTIVEELVFERTARQRASPDLFKMRDAIIHFISGDLH